MFIVWLIGMVVSIILLGVAALVVLNTMTNTNRQATRVETGGFKFVVKGESLSKILDNLSGGLFVDQKTHQVKESGSKKENRRRIGFLEKNLGITWVSILWPIKKVHRFEVVADKLIEDLGPDGKELPVRERIKVSLRETDYLRHRFPHPVLVKDVELGGDRWKTDIIVMLDLAVTNPATVVFDYKGKVLNQVDAAVGAEVIDYSNEPGLTYNEFIQQDKGATSKFAGKILALNGSTSPGAEVDGLESRFGIKICAAWVPVADLSPAQKVEEEASKAVERERQLADAKEQTARGEQALQRGALTGTAEGLAAIADKLGGKISQDGLAHVLAQKVRTDNIARAPHLQTYVEGGGNAVPTIQTKGKDND